MPLPHQAVQACHAAVSAGRDLVTCDQPNLVLVTVPDELALKLLSCRLTMGSIGHRVFREEDMGGRATALATCPLTQKARRHFRDLPLYYGQ